MNAVIKQTKMKKYTVYVYYWPADRTHRELWLGYTLAISAPKVLVGKFTVIAETRARAITAAIKQAKEKQKKWSNQNGLHA
jgi:hypothetical protein